jgi:hypothetical protein
MSTGAWGNCWYANGRSTGCIEIVRTGLWHRNGSCQESGSQTGQPETTAHTGIPYVDSKRQRNSYRDLLKLKTKQTASELYRPSDLRLSPKVVPTFADRGCQVVSMTDPYGRILGFLDRSRYFSIK